jgi:hypothetical protein
VLGSARKPEFPALHGGDLRPVLRLSRLQLTCDGTVMPRGVVAAKLGRSSKPLQRNQGDQQPSERKTKTPHRTAVYKRTARP